MNLDILKIHGKNIKLIKKYPSTVSPFIKGVSCPSETGFHIAATLHSTFHTLYVYILCVNNSQIRFMQYYLIPVPQ